MTTQRTTAPGTERAARQVLGRDGRTVDRPVGGGSDATFPLAYVRTGPRADVPPVVVLPGGPGLASVLPYVQLRADAARRGLDVLMVEHRGIGLSRRDASGAELPRSAVTVAAVVDDLAAVLDDAGVRRAVLYGASYGTYVAQAFGARHPDRVAAMVLDSPVLAPADDLALSRRHRRRLLWDGALRDGDDPALAGVAAAVHALADDVPAAELAHVVQVVHEFAGPDVLHRLLLARRAGRLRAVWDRVASLGAGESEGAGVPFVMEPDLVAGIMYDEVGFGLPPDGGPLDPQLTFADAAARHAARETVTADAAADAAVTVGHDDPAGASPTRPGPTDLPAALPAFAWPTAVLSGERDLRTPRPVAERVVDLVPGAVLVPLAATGHSALDTHRRAALHAAHAAAVGAVPRLPALADRLAALPRRGPSRLVGTAVTAVVRATTRHP
ncbi:alpha/beta fold hydrolase [Cellulomonas shaoxiangyii]|uniref:Alpha/beta fold hydrolase n=1 Tax=Cellulomonas shaoxiangyii TaxID=2566013 RepID=A0A4P7SIM5_9CELL|nr:alpha/beta fold hydrolase [Cellulomonas shaoxiangyii]QCB92313.1 alpha/beta fold hydrolase [Cellulomonas shaoxiangyii]TGY86292.1 alpha/beta fold hydrolase [Cellulomonas shaoxiangyii]